MGMRIQVTGSMWSKLLHAIFVSECDFCEHELGGNDFNRICKHCASTLNELVKAHLRSARCEICDQVLTDHYHPRSKLKSKNSRLKKIKTLPKLHCSDCLNSSDKNQHNFRIANRSLLSSNLATSTKTSSNLAQRLIYDFKFKKHPSYAKFISYLCGKHLLAYLANFDLLVPIPLSPAGILERGFCQVSTVTKSISKTLNIPYKLIVKRNEERYQVPQHQLTRTERLDLIEGKYLIENSALKQLANIKSILLIDDIYTTGATIQYIGELLHQHFPEAEIGSLTFLRISLSTESDSPNVLQQENKNSGYPFT